MSFFYDLNKRLADLAKKQNAQHIAEEAKVTAPKSKLAESIEVAETGYSAKAGRAGKDLGKPGKNFNKIAKSAGEKYGSKAAGERVAGAVLNKLRGKTEEAATPMTPKQKSFAKLAPPTDKITFADKIAGAKKEVDEMLGDVAAEAMKAAIGRGKKVVADEGNAFTGALAKTPKGGKFKVGNKEFTDNSDLEEGSMKHQMHKDAERMNRAKFCAKYGNEHGEFWDNCMGDLDEGYAEMDAWLAQREKEKGTGKFDKKKISTGTVYTRKHDDDADDDTEASNEPKRRGRPKGKDKGPERVTAKSYKYKAGRPAKTNEGDNCCPHCGESLEVDEVAPPGAKAERMVKGIKKSLSKDGHLSDKDKAIAYATTWKAKKAGKVEEESTDKEDTKAERAGKKVAKDIEHDEGHKGKDDNRAEKAGKKVTKDIEYDDKKDRKEKKEEKVDETTVAGSVATSTAAPKASKGMQFGKGVYEGFNNSVEKMISESVEVAETIAEMEGEGKTITVTASGPEADMLMQLLKAAGLSGQGAGCGCGQTPCGCEQVDENSPDWPTNTETLDSEPNLRTYSGGLNGPKSTGQTTIPVIANQGRQTSMEESVELERSLFKTWKNYKG